MRSLVQSLSAKSFHLHFIQQLQMLPYFRTLDKYTYTQAHTYIYTSCNIKYITDISCNIMQLFLPQ